MFRIGIYSLCLVQRLILFSFSELDKLGYTRSSENGLFQLIFESRVISIVVSESGLYMLVFNEFVCFQTEPNNNMYTHVLWLRQLGHISQHRVKKLLKDANLLSLHNNS